jgi:hypothetical protein
VWRVHAEATLPDGVTFVREAVLRPTNDARRPMLALAWTEADRMPAIVAPDPSARPSTSLFRR